MSKINYCSYWSWPLCALVWFHCSCESYCSGYCGAHHRQERLTGKKVKFSWKFRLIGWIEFKIRPFVRAQTKKAKDKFVMSLMQNG